MNGATKPRLSLWQIIQMNLGFLGLQFSFGLQQGNMAPIYSFLGAREDELPLLQLAGPVTGLLVQPIIGALSDRTHSRWGRRTPYFITGAIMCSVGLLFMPLSSSILMAVSLLWLLDAGNNITMEPYRAYVKDRLDESQHGIGFLSQSAFTGLAQTLSFLAPTILVYAFGMSVQSVDSHGIPMITRVAFMIGAVLSLSTILWSIWRVPELPLSDTERAQIRAMPRSVGATLGEIWNAIVEMPQAMRRLALMCLFQWYGIAVYWSYALYSIGLSVYGTNNPQDAAFKDAMLTQQQVGAFYNAIAFVAAFAMAPLTRRYGAGRMHAFCLTAAGLGMLAIPHVQDKMMLFIPAIGVGLGWASMMGNPYVMLADSIPPERTGVYMGIFNMFIVIPMLLIAVTLPLYYQPLMDGDARNVIMLAGSLMLCGAVATLFIRTPHEVRKAP
jgi:maltose/moltooligosaccharide transporter